MKLYKIETSDIVYLIIADTVNDAIMELDHQYKEDDKDLSLDEIMFIEVNEDINKSPAHLLMHYTAKETFFDGEVVDEKEYR